MATIDIITLPSTAEIRWIDSSGVSAQSMSLRGDVQNKLSFIGYSASFDATQTPTGGTTLVDINDSTTGTISPGTTGMGLGTASLRWNTYATTLDASGTVSLTNTGAASGAQLLFSTSSAPSALAAGQMWWDGTALNFRTGSSTVNLLAAAGAITSLNGIAGSSAPVQTFAAGTTGTDIAWSSVNNGNGTGTHTLNVPSASTTARGVVTTASQTFLGAKRFNSGIEVASAASVNRYQVVYNDSFDSLDFNFV